MSDDDALGDAAAILEQLVLEVADIAAAYPPGRRAAAAKALRRLAAAFDGSARGQAFQAAAERLEAVITEPPADER